MDIISSRDFYDICNNINKPIKFMYFNQPKVYEKDDTTIVKVFHPKKNLISSDRIKPRALRFYHNVESLHAHGFEVPRVIKIQFCADLKIYLLHYTKIQGHDVRTLAKQGNINIINDVAELLAELHKKGIFFRSIHLANLLYKPNGKIALLDITDVKFKSRALTLYLRFRNLKHLLHQSIDKDLWQAFGVTNFLDIYFKSASISRFSRMILTRLIERSLKNNFTKWSN